MELGFNGLHRLLCEFDSRVIECGDQINDRMVAIVGHMGCKGEDSGDGIQQRAVPVVFEDPPTALDGIVLAVVWGIVGQVDGELILDSKGDKTRHKLSSPTVVFGTIIQIEDQGIDMRKAVTDAPPPVFQAIDQTIGSDLGRHHVQKQVVKLGEKNPDGSQRFIGLEVVIGSPDLNPTFSTPRERPDFDSGFGIH